MQQRPPSLMSRTQATLGTLPQNQDHDKLSFYTDQQPYDYGRLQPEQRKVNVDEMRYDGSRHNTAYTVNHANCFKY